jgi:hypothetical protein
MESRGTDREVLANRRDIKIKNKTICLLIHVAIPSDKNVKQKETEKKLKYKYFSTEIHRMWNMKFFVIPVIIRITGIVTKGLQNLETVSGKHSTDSLQKKILVLGTLQIIRKVVGCITASRGEVSGERKPVIRDDNNNNDNKKVTLFLFLSKNHAMKTYLGSGGMAPCILDIGTRLM